LNCHGKDNLSWNYCRTVYSQPDLRLTVADWLKAASDFLIESVQVKP